MLVCIGVGRIFPGGPLMNFPKVFLGAINSEICFLTLEPKKTAFFANVTEQR